MSKGSFSESSIICDETSILERHKTALENEIGDLITCFLESMKDRVNLAFAIGKTRSSKTFRCIKVEGHEQANEFTLLGSYTQPIQKVTISRISSVELLTNVTALVKGAKEIELELCIVPLIVNYFELLALIPRWKFSLCFNVQSNEVGKVVEYFKSHTDNNPNCIELIPPLVFPSSKNCFTFFCNYPKEIFDKSQLFAREFLSRINVKKFGTAESLANRLQELSDEFLSNLLCVITAVGAKRLLIYDYANVLFLDLAEDDLTNHKVIRELSHNRIINSGIAPGSINKIKK